MKSGSRVNDSKNTVPSLIAIYNFGLSASFRDTIINPCVIYNTRNLYKKHRIVSNVSLVISSRFRDVNRYLIKVAYFASSLLGFPAFADYARLSRNNAAV